ncbi:MAG: rhodanese-related sulfurtransferase [Oscillatoriales cyanobacterium RM2_1_1]|nr:rhodanese-related sulfurtransferase [Oscillatoriales cyanobacterium SM2_3_0]NJO46947.1 rhodanese-related sulfurtransferase [Oscillatoriales cyanobacterium RM2_1_1]
MARIQPISEVRVAAVGSYLSTNSAQAAIETSSPSIQLVDVREPEELAIAQIEGFLNLPLSQFSAWSGQVQAHLDPEVETWVLCHHGIRSAQMCQWLMQQGFQNVKNILGGIDAYSLEVDPTVPRY